MKIRFFQSGGELEEEQSDFQQFINSDLAENIFGVGDSLLQSIGQKQQLKKQKQALIDENEFNESLNKSLRARANALQTANQYDKAGSTSTLAAWNFLQNLPQYNQNISPSTRTGSTATNIANIVDSMLTGVMSAQKKQKKALQNNAIVVAGQLEATPPPTNEEIIGTRTGSIPVNSPVAASEKVKAGKYGTKLIKRFQSEGW